MGLIINSINFNISTDDVIERLSKASGNSSFRVSAPLSGFIRNNKFRFTLPIRLFNHPFIAVVYGEIINHIDGSKVIYSFAPPWIGALVLATIYLLLNSLFSLIVSLSIIATIGLFGFILWHLDKKVLISRVISHISDANV